MNKKLIAEDINRMKYMLGYKPGRVISEQEFDFDDFEMSDIETAPVKPDVKPDIDTPTRPDIHPEDDPLRPGRRTRPRPAPQASDDEFDMEDDDEEFDMEDDDEFDMEDDDKEFDMEDDFEFDMEDDDEEFDFEVDDEEVDDELMEFLEQDDYEDGVDDDSFGKKKEEYNDDEYDY